MKESPATQSMTDPLVVKGLEKSYKSKKEIVRAVQGVSFSVKKGEIFGLLGPNGAGKTTTINILTGLLTQDAGTATYFGKAWCEETHNKVNATTAYTWLNGTLTVEQNLKIYTKMYAVKDPAARITKLLAMFNIADLRNRKVYELSSGQSVRVNLCKCLINDPELIFLDEATAGLDPEIAADVRLAIKKLGKTIVFTSHIMREVEELCDRVAFIKEGKILLIDTPTNLKKKLKKDTLDEVFIHLARNA